MRSLGWDENQGGTGMELALAISTLEHEELSYVAQLGVKGVILGGTGITEQLQWDHSRC